MTEGHQLLGTKSLWKPAAFSGREENWARWCFAFESFTSLPHLQKAMEQAANMDSELVRLSTTQPRQRILHEHSSQHWSRCATMDVPSTS